MIGKVVDGDEGVLNCGPYTTVRCTVVTGLASPM